MPWGRRTDARDFTLCGSSVKEKLGASRPDLVGTGTSVMPGSRTAGVRRTKATTGWRRKPSAPTRTLDASAPTGIFFMKCSSAWGTTNHFQAAPPRPAARPAAEFAAAPALQAPRSGERLTLLRSIVTASWFGPFLASAAGEG